MATPAVRISLAEFLRMEETKPYRELIDGEVVEKAMPGFAHSKTVTRLLTRLESFTSREGGADVHTGLRCLFVPEQRVYLPDVCVFSPGRLPNPSQDPIEAVPDFVIEVLSPDDRASRVNEKIAFYRRAGVRLLWVVDPERAVVTVHKPGQAPEEFAPPDVLSAGPVLPAFEVGLAELFASQTGVGG